MNYVVAAWLSCGAILLLYALRTVRRERCCGGRWHRRGERT